MKALARIDAERTKALDRVAGRVHREFVQPICDKYNLHFLSGNGMWYFYSKSNERDMYGSLDGEEARRAGYGLKRVIKLLSTEIDRNMDLGCYIGCCEPRTKKKKS